MRGVLLMVLGGWLPVATWAAAGVPASTGSVAKPVPVPTSTLNRHDVSYAIGYRIGSEFAHGRPDVDLPVLMRAIRDAYARHPPAVPMLVMQQQIDALERRMHRQDMAAFRRMARENAQASVAFMRANGDKPGVVSLPSGVQYRVLKVGHGAAPTLASTVVMNYRGSLINGMQFDSTWVRGKPVTFAVRDMLPGWRDVLPLMHVGAHWQVFIPPRQAYGERGQLPRIGPNEALVFEIQLLGVKP
ncbi:MAG TPA: FKBP-type peptidyl-prolyl cis-trans isomerase [Rhodanobacteraceae bacterium]